jgi:hypothetical protein
MNVLTRLGIGVVVGCVVATALQAQGSVQGRWQTSTEFQGGPYILELRVSGTRLTGTVRQSSGPQQGPAAIFDGSATGQTISFKVKSPDGDREVTFTGRLDGTKLALKRDVQIRKGGDPGGAGVFGATGPRSLTVERTKRAAE